MPLPLKLIVAFKRLFGPRRKFLGRCPLSVSLLQQATTIEPTIQDYLTHVIELGRASSHDRGRCWHISGPGPAPVPGGGLGQFPILHAKTDSDNALLIVLNPNGGLSVYGSAPIKDLGQIRLKDVVTPSDSLSPRERFYWGVCPHDPAFVRHLHETIRTKLGPFCGPDDLQGQEADRECFLGMKTSVIGLRVLWRSEEEGFPSVAIPQFFHAPLAGSDNILMVDQEHSYLDAVTSIDGMMERIRAFHELRS